MDTKRRPNVLIIGGIAIIILSGAMLLPRCESEQPMEPTQTEQTEQGSRPPGDDQGIVEQETLMVPEPQ